MEIDIQELKDIVREVVNESKISNKTEIFENQIEYVVVNIINKLLSNEVDYARQLTFYKDEWEVRNYNQLLNIEENYGYRSIMGFSSELVGRRGIDGMMIDRMIDLAKSYLGSEEDEVPKSIKQRVMELFASK